MIQAKPQDLRRPLKGQISQSSGVPSKFVLVNTGVLTKFKPEIEEEVRMNITGKLRYFFDNYPFLCPACGTPLGAVAVSDDNTLTCLNGHEFRILDQVPALTLEAYDSSVQQEDTLNSFNFQYAALEWIYDYDCRRVSRIVEHNVGLTADDVADMRVLVVGCGSGAEIEIFKQLGARSVIGIDLSTSLAEAQKRQLLNDNTIVIRADAACIPVAKQSFDLIYCDGVLPHTEAPEEITSAMTQLLAPGGALYLRTLLKPVSLRARLQLMPRKLLRKFTKVLTPKSLWSISYVFALLSKIPLAGSVFKRLFIYYDVNEDDLRITRLTNFRMYGDHTYRHHLSAEQVVNAIERDMPEIVIQRIGSFFKGSLPLE